MEGEGEVQDGMRMGMRMGMGNGMEQSKARVTSWGTCIIED